MEFFHSVVLVLPHEYLSKESEYFYHYFPFKAFPQVINCDININCTFCTAQPETVKTMKIGRDVS